MDRIVVNIVGDSIVNGFGVKGNSFSKIESDKILFNNFGVNGETSSSVLDRIDNLLDCDLLVLFYGLNDFLNGMPVKYVVENTEKILRKSKSKVLVCIPHMVDTNELRFIFNPGGINRKIEKLYDEYLKLNFNNFKIINFYSLLKEVELFDGIHPNEKTHEDMKKLFLEFLEVNYGFYK